MNVNEVVAWLESLVSEWHDHEKARHERQERVAREDDAHARRGQLILRPPTPWDPASTAQWTTEAETALRAIFPASHTIMTSWVTAREAQVYSRIEGLRGVVEAALRIIHQGRLKTVLNEIRAETVGEVLDQAETLVAEKALTPAAVLAGGALETHLHHLCVQAQLNWSGHGSISAYLQVLDKERKSGKAIITAQDSKYVLAWADARNRAAHKPTEFTDTASEVRLMIDGIRQFVTRTT